jgi:hypothetical protein
MGLDANNIPDATTAPPGAARSNVRKAIKRAHISRRGMLRTVVGAGMVIGIASLDLLPTGRKAAAAPSTLGACSYYDPPTLTASAYAAWANTCNANGTGQHVSPVYCSPSTGYHRTDTLRSGCYSYQYKLATRCLTKNAWVWRKNGVAPEYANKRCSDGLVVRKNTCTGAVPPRYKSTCVKYL